MLVCIGTSVATPAPPTISLSFVYASSLHARDVFGDIALRAIEEQIHSFSAIETTCAEIGRYPKLIWNQEENTG